jgi:hypothetical protein
VFENRVLRKILGSRRGGLSRGWRKMCSETFCFVLPTKYYSGAKTKEYEMGGQCGTRERERVRRDCCLLTRRKETTRKT